MYGASSPIKGDTAVAARVLGQGPLASLTQHASRAADGVFSRRCFPFTGCLGLTLPMVHLRRDSPGWHNNRPACMPSIELAAKQRVAAFIRAGHPLVICRSTTLLVPAVPVGG